MLDIDQLSFWEKETYLNSTDFLILGGGIVGLSTALYLKQRHPNKKVTVLERGYFPSGASTKNAGFACIGSPSEVLSDLEKEGEQKVFELVERRYRGLKQLVELLGKNAIEYAELGSHELFMGTHEQSYLRCADQLEYLNKHFSQITGLKASYKIAPSAIIDAGFSGFKYAISQHAEGQLNPAKMMHALFQKAVEIGVFVFHGITVNTIEKNHVNTTFGPIKFDRLGICINGFAQQFLPGEDISPARAQVLITNPIPNLKLRGTFHFDEGFYYFRNVGNRVLFGGGRNLDVSAETTTHFGMNDKIQTKLKSILAENILPNQNFEITNTWSGIMGIGGSKQPIVRELEQNIFSGVRLGGMGVAIGNLVGQELALLMSN
jgi:gamma-glutamylputrescine oxidase